jgi:hypothetical protein
VPDWALRRPCITKLIAEGRRWCPLTFVTAPAGSGKTMALSLWAAAEPGTVAWVTVDQFDNRPGVFWTYVVAALRQSGVALPGVLPSARRRNAGYVFLLWLAAALAAQDPPVTLGWPDLSSSGCRSSSSVTGSGRCCGVTVNWPMPTGACSPQPRAATGSRLRKAPQIRPPSSRPGRSANASGSCYGTYQAC